MLNFSEIAMAIVAACLALALSVGIGMLLAT